MDLLYFGYICYFAKFGRTAYKNLDNYETGCGSDKLPKIIKIPQLRV